jgi:hypothetical protein
MMWPMTHPLMLSQYQVLKCSQLMPT